MEKKKILKYITKVVIPVLFAVILIVIVTSDNFKAIVIKRGLTIKKIGNSWYEDNNAYMDIETYNFIINKDLWCITTDNEDVPKLEDNWQKIENNHCNVKFNNGDKYIYIRDKNSIGEKIVISDYISNITKIYVPNTDIKIIKDEIKELNVEPIVLGNPDTTLNYISENEEIVKVEDGKIQGVNDGKTNIIITDNYGNSETINVQVTSLISLPEINNKKPFISNKQYTQEEAEILDEYLFYQIDEAGYKTRAGVVAAARFLSLELKYRIPYFIENGRVTHFNHQRPYCDGEGRYFHRGLYLSTDKFEDIEKSVSGPAMWGAYIMEWSEDNGIIRNGLDCSGFVCWCLINGGFDQLGDIGAGLSEGLPTLSDYGVSQKITMELLESGKVKAGDPIGFNGHIGIIIGIDEENVYVADTLYHSKGLVATKYTYKELVNSAFTHIYDYTEVYGGQEGNYTNMW